MERQQLPVVGAGKRNVLWKGGGLSMQSPEFGTCNVAGSPAFAAGEDMGVGS